MWGNNTFCQIEDETRYNVLKPKMVLENVSAFSYANYRAGAITKDGNLYMWGNNDYGQVGDGTTENVTTPIKILENVATVSMNNHEHTIGAITENGELYIWGYNQCGQVGDGTTKNALKPKMVLENVSYASIDTGTTGAVTEDGELYMWGKKGVGQIVNGILELVSLPYNSAPVVSKKTEKEVKAVSVNSNDNIKNTSTTLEESTLETTNLQNIVTTGENGNASGLIPDTIYNYYVMKSKSEEQPFTADNLLYIGQALSDASGNLHIDYEMKEEYENPQTVVVGMAQLELSDGDVTVSDIIYNGEEQDIYPIVTYQGVELEEEKDYELSGDFTAEEVGEYTITIEGIGYYKGTVSKNYKVYTDEEVPTLTPTQMPLTPEPTKTLSVTATPAPTKTLSVTATPTPKLKTEYKKLQKTYGDKAFSVAVKKNSPLKYKTSESSVATVNQKGTVTIKGCGKTDITIIDSATGFVYQYITLTVVPKKPSLSAVKTSTKKVLKIKWKKDTKADGYEIYYATNKTFSKKTAVLIKSSKTTKKTVKNLKSGKKYYVKMRAYKNWDGTKIKGAWSKEISMKVK